MVEVPILPAATVLLVRNAAAGLEVFMVERHAEIDFVAGALVFPGGRVDPADGDPALRSRCRGADDLDEAALAFGVAAIRETFEECGVLLACERGAAELVSGERLRSIAERHREAVHAGETPMLRFAELEDLELVTDRLVHFAHWITPEGMPKRFDTHFYLAEAPEDHIAVHDGTESVDSTWIRPADAVQAEADGKRSIILPTLLNLKKLGRSARVAEALEAARTSTVVPVLPRVRQGTVRIPPEADYGVSEIDVKRLRRPRG